MSRWVGRKGWQRWDSGARHSTQFLGVDGEHGETGSRGMKGKVGYILRMVALEVSLVPLECMDQRGSLAHKACGNKMAN